ncbi:MAG: hypothetical protein WC839_00960 [Candidatus Paceibacterota bacterium]
MKKIQKKNNIKFNDDWSFAIMNGRLVEIHFKKGLGVWAHFYVKRSEYFTKKEQKMIDKDIKKCVFSYQKGFYYDRIKKIKYKVPSVKKIFPDLNKKRKILNFLKDLR